MLLPTFVLCDRGQSSALWSIVDRSSNAYSLAFESQAVNTYVKFYCTCNFVLFCTYVLTLVCNRRIINGVWWWWWWWWSKCSCACRDCRKENFLPLKHSAALGKVTSTMTWKRHITWRTLMSAASQFGMHESVIVSHMKDLLLNWCKLMVVVTLMHKTYFFSHHDSWVCLSRCSFLSVNILF